MNTSEFSPEQRLRKVAEIINKGIYLLAKKQGWIRGDAGTYEMGSSFKANAPQDHALHMLDNTQIEILRMIKEKGSIKVSECAELIGRSTKCARSKLRSMELENILIRVAKSEKDPHACFIINSCVDINKSHL